MKYELYEILDAVRVVFQMNFRCLKRSCVEFIFVEVGGKMSEATGCGCDS